MTHDFRLSPEVAEDYLRLRNNILALNSKKRIKTIGITSTMHGEGCSTVTANLAVTLAGNGVSRILLIDGNIRRPSLHNLFGLEKEEGLTEVIFGEIALAGVLKKTPIPNMLFMTSGRINIDPDRVFSSERFKDLLKVVEKHFEYVLFDFPPISLYPDSTVLSPLLDGVLLVIQAERVIYEVIQKAREKIENNGGNILGVILNRRKYYIPDVIYRRL